MTLHPWLRFSLLGLGLGLGLALACEDPGSIDPGGAGPVQVVVQETNADVPPLGTPAPHCEPEIHRADVTKDCDGEMARVVLCAEFALSRCQIAYLLAEVAQCRHPDLIYERDVVAACPQAASPDASALDAARVDASSSDAGQ